MGAAPEAAMRGPVMGRRAAMAWMAACAGLGTPLARSGVLGATHAPRGGGLYSISLAQWSLHRTLKGGLLDPMDFPREALVRFGIDAVEYVNTFYRDRLGQQGWASELRRRCDDAGVRSVLIMCDGEGALGDPEERRRVAVVERHFKWVEAAVVLGCHAIRVNAASAGPREEQARLTADGLRRLAEFAETRGIDVLVENHGGLSSDASWLAEVVRRAAHPRCGTLPDFGNFCMDWSRADDPGAWYDRYRGVAELMPLARGVSAKSHEFDAGGNEVRTDYRRMLRIVVDSGYRGRVGVEYEGEKHTEPEGIRLTRDLLRRVHDEFIAEGIGRAP